MLGCFAVDFLYTLRGVYLLLCEEGLLCSLFLLEFHFRWSRSRRWFFLYYTQIDVLTDCKPLSISSYNVYWFDIPRS